MVIADFILDTTLNPKVRKMVEDSTKSYVIVLGSSDDEWCIVECDTMEQLIKHVNDSETEAGWQLYGICMYKIPQSFRVIKQLDITLLGEFMKGDGH